MAVPRYTGNCCHLDDFTMRDNMQTLDLSAHKIVPVIVNIEMDYLDNMINAFLEAGLKIIEITLRNENALAAIKHVAKHYPAMTLGAGTILNKSQFQAAIDHGAQFFVSPGFTPQLCEFARINKLIYLPGINSVSEMMQVAEYGISVQKFFPAELSGGIKRLQAFAQVMPHIHFCPTGGINGNNYLDYLALPNVKMVGGSWLLPPKLAKTSDWQDITQTIKTTLQRITA